MRKFDILVIDDEEEPRHVWFRAHLGALGHRVTSAYEAESALDLLRTRKFDLVFFDHDLGNTPVNGSMIAGQVLMNPDTYHAPSAVWVHTMNYHGAQNIASKFYSAQVPVTVESFYMLQVNQDLQGALERLVP